MTRIDLVVPEELEPELVIPPLAVTDGTADPEWVEVPVSDWRLGRRTMLRLPLDRRSARSARRFVRLRPWEPVTRLVFGAASLTFVLADLSPSQNRVALVVAAAALATSFFLYGRGLPRQVPTRNRAGDLRLPGVAEPVALAWMAANPGVTAAE
ncbi:hypothetical protein [Actinoplanes sp. M2I2]|uniref:hypothetical protein n=1 Tax=Actinoplanes sp. M2I2 TaxID=1734444 RepID=UPI00202197D9|nr:hypothetical protein [Actinoplanes sp. M2I2]